MRLNQSIYDKKYIIYSIAFLGTIGIGLIIINTYPIFNPDGLLYLKVAESYLHGGVRATLTLYNWPFYSILIAWIHRLFGLSLIHSAYALNLLFAACTSVLFIRLIDLLGGERKILWIALLVVLCFHNFMMYQRQLIRGHGYWLFYLFSLYFLISFFNTRKYYYVIAWYLCVYIAVLFRVEGLAFLVLVPLAVFFQSDVTKREKIINYFLLNVFTIILALIIFCIISFLHKWGRFEEILLYRDYYLKIAVKDFFRRAYAVQHYVLTFYSKDSANTFTIFGMLGGYVSCIFSVLPVSYLFVLGYSWIKRILPATDSAKKIIYAYLLINIIITILFYYRSMFLSDRYIFPLALTLLLCVPFGLTNLLCHAVQKNKIYSGYSIMLIFVVLSMAGMMMANFYPFGKNKLYMYQAARWVNENSSDNAKVFTNNSVMGYRTGRIYEVCDGNTSNCFNGTGHFTQSPKKGNYIIVNITNKQQDFLDFLEKKVGMKPLMIFFSKHLHRKAVIFKL